MANIKTQCCAATKNDVFLRTFKWSKNGGKNSTAKATIDEEGFAGIFFFLRSFIRDTDEFLHWMQRNQKKTKYAKCFIQHEMEHNNSSSSSPVSTHWIYYYYEFIFVCDSFQPTKRTHSFLLPSFRSPVISIYTRLAVRSTHAKAIWIYWSVDCCLLFYFFCFVLLLFSFASTSAARGPSCIFIQPSKPLSYALPRIRRLFAARQQHRTQFKIPAIGAFTNLYA